MPLSPASGGGPGGAGSSRGALGPETNTFGTAATANRAAAEALRDAYAGANAAWLAMYNADRGFFISLEWDDGDALQRRNRAGNGWEDVTSIIVGPRGAPAPPVMGAPVVESLTVPALRTHALGSNPLRIGPAVAPGQRLLPHGLVIGKPAGTRATGATGAPIFWSADGGAPRTSWLGNNRFFYAAAADRPASSGRFGLPGLSLYLGSGDDSRVRSLADIGAQDQDVSVLLVYSLHDFSTA